MSGINVQIKIGADPELFLRDKNTGKFVSAHDLLPGDKFDPFPVTYGAIQVDGVAGEFNIDPASDPNTFNRNVYGVIGQIKDRLPSNIEIVNEPVAFFEKGYFDTLPDINRELGCNPDYNAWTGMVNKRPPEDVVEEDGTIMRTAAGHIHIGWGSGFNPQDSNHFEDCMVVVRELDYWLGVYSLLWDRDSRRRSLYGKAGAFRPKSYGVEYRPLSNVWLKDKGLSSWVWDKAYSCVSSILNGDRGCVSKWGDLAQRTIDNNEYDWYTNTNHPLNPLRNYLSFETPPGAIFDKQQEVNELAPKPRTRKKVG